MNAEIVASKAACSKIFHPKVGTTSVDIYNLHTLFHFVDRYGVLYNQRKLVDLNIRFMESQEHYYTGNKKQTNLLLNEILPALEGLMLNANKDFFTIQDLNLRASFSPVVFFLFLITTKETWLVYAH